MNKWAYLENADACLSFLFHSLLKAYVLLRMNVEKIYVYVKMSEKMGSFGDDEIMSCDLGSCV